MKTKLNFNTLAYVAALNYGLNGPSKKTPAKIVRLYDSVMLSAGGSQTVQVSDSQYLGEKVSAYELTSEAFTVAIDNAIVYAAKNRRTAIRLLFMLLEDGKANQLGQAVYDSIAIFGLNFGDFSGDVETIRRYTTVAITRKLARIHKLANS